MSTPDPTEPDPTEPDPTEADPKKASDIFGNHDIQSTLVTDGGTHIYKKPVNIRTEEPIYEEERSGQSGNSGAGHTYERRPTVKGSILSKGSNTTYEAEVNLTSTQVILPASEAFRTQQTGAQQQAQKQRQLRPTTPDPDVK